MEKGNIYQTARDGGGGELKLGTFIEEMFLMMRFLVIKVPELISKVKYVCQAVSSLGGCFRETAVTVVL